MTQPTRVTYGELINRALLEMAEAWQLPIEFPDARSALLAAQARAGLYRAAANTIQRFTVPPHLGHDDEPTTLAQAKILRLAHQLKDSVDATSSARDAANVDQWSGFRPTPFGARLARAERLAGAAWDLLAIRLGHDRPSIDGPATAIRAENVIADAALVTRAMAGLDTALGEAITHITRKLSSDSPIRRVLTRVAANCTQTGGASLAPHAREVANLMSADLDTSTWMSLDAIQPLSTRAPRGLRTTVDALAAIDAYHARLHQHRAELSVRDLTTLASLAARLGGLVHQTATRLPDGEDAAVLASRLVRAWRHTHHTLRPFASIQPSTVSFQRTAALITWADHQQHAYVPPRRGSATWNAWVDNAYALTRKLSGLATVAENATTELLRQGRLYLARPGRAYFGWRPAAITARPTVELTDSLLVVRTLSEQLVTHLATAAPPFSPHHHPGRLLREAFPADATTYLSRVQPERSVLHVPPSSDRPRRGPRL